MYCCSWTQLLILYLLILNDCIYLFHCARRDSRCNGIFSLSCFSLVRSRCLFCAALCTLNCVEYHECASCIIDVGLHVRCAMYHASVPRPVDCVRTCIIYAVRDDVHPVFLDLTASS